VFLRGPSGTGKSTLLGLVGGVLVPQQGSVSVLGQSLGALSSHGRDQFRVDHIGFVFQQFNLIAYLSMLDNVLLPCRFSKRRREHACRRSGTVEADARRLLAALDLPPQLASRPVNALSVGQQQRVAAARALIGQPELVIADEPTSALDAERQAGFLDLLLAECAHAGAALLFVSHDQRLSGRFDRNVDLVSINKAVVEGGSA
jgi:putative ABC transport system ATP-binding protein